MVAINCDSLRLGTGSQEGFENAFSLIELRDVLDLGYMRIDSGPGNGIFYLDVESGCERERDNSRGLASGSCQKEGLVDCVVPKEPRRVHMRLFFRHSPVACSAAYL